MIKTEVGPDYFYYVPRFLRYKARASFAGRIVGTLNREYLEKCCLMPRYPETYLEAVMDRFRPKKILEIGTYWGGSAAFFSSRKHVKQIHTIDVIEREEPHNLWNAVLEPEERGKIIDHWVIDDKTKKELIGALDFDFCFIDGLHTYEGVKFDFECVKDKCDAVLFHDFGTNEGVTDFINEQDNIEWQSIELSFALWVNK